MKIKNSIGAMFAIVLSVSVPTVQAHAENAGVTAALNELNYTLSVQWDQKDQAVKQEAQAKFTAKIAEAIKNGASVDEVFNGIAASTNLSAQTKQDLAAIKDQVKAGKLSAAEGQQKAIQYMQEAQAKGVLFSSAGIVIAAALIVALIVVIALSSSSTAVVVTPAPVCTDYYDAYTNAYLYTTCN